MIMMKDIAPDGSSGHLCSTLPLSALRLLVPPLRLLSAAIWKTVQHRDVADYGILEEFVTMVTDLVPELLTRRQKTQLTLGLRARLILNTCQLGAPCESENVQPHLDRMQELIQSWLSQANGGNLEMSSSEFIDLVQNLLKNPDEKEHFFQVFEEEFGPRYDEAIQALMWLFLTRLEKLLPVQTFHQVASVFGQGSCILEECVQSVSTESAVTPVSWCDELRALLQFHKDLNQLDQNDLLLDSPCIISALRLPTAQTAETVQTPDRSIVGQSAVKEDSAALLCSFQINAKTERFTNESVMDRHHLTSDESGTQLLLGDEIRPDRGVEVLGVRVDPMSCLIKDCCVRLQRLDKLVDMNVQPVRAARNLRLKRILQEEKKHLLQDTSSTSSEASEKEVSSPLHEDSFMAPVSTSSEDSWSYYSENSCEANATSAADSWSIYSGDDSSVLCPVNSLAERDSFSSYSNSDCTFLNPKNASTSSQDRPLKKTQNPLCFICKEQVNKSLRMHMKTHFPNKDYTCPQCDGRYNLLTSLLRHMKKTCFDYPQQGGDPEPARTQDLSKCEKCGDQFRYKVSLQKHMMTHHELYCSVCRRVLRDAATLARHQTSHTPFQCTRCDQFFTVFKHLLRHYENIHKVRRPFLCNHCPKTYPRLRFLIRHEWQHTGCLPFQCTLCNLKFKSDCDLVAHQRVHTREKPYLCADCGKTFARKPNLLRHLRVIHSESRNEKRYSCSQCDKSFKEKGSLKKHQRSKHFFELSRYPCPYCGKMVSSSTMARHKLIHTGERPFKCTMPKCDKCFRSSTEVKRHVLQHHTKERPFKCHTCGKGFVRTCDLTAHTRIHSEEKQCVCPICNKAFLKLYSMQRHKRLVHGVITH